VIVRCFDDEGGEVCAVPSSVGGGELETFLQEACGRSPAEFFCDRLFVSTFTAPLLSHLSTPRYRDFHQQRMQVLRRFGALLSAGEPGWECGDSFVDNELESI